MSDEQVLAKVTLKEEDGYRILSAGMINGLETIRGNMVQANELVKDLDLDENVLANITKKLDDSFKVCELIANGQAQAARWQAVGTTENTITTRAVKQISGFEEVEGLE